MKNYYKFFGIGIVLLFLLRIVASSFFVSKEIKDNTSNTYNSHTRGLSIVDEYLKGVSNEATVVKEKYVLLDRANKFPQNGILLLASPQFSLSKTDQALIFKWMSEGGTAWLSIEEKNQIELLNGFLSEWGKKLETQDLDSFQNLVVEKTTSTKNIGPYHAGKSYAFYSPLRFEKCEERIDCFVKEIPIGQGALWVTLGLFPLSNAMIWREKNPELLTEIAPKKILIDEQIHGFVERDVWDLFKRIEFMVPILSILVFSFLILFFSKNREKLLKQSIEAPRDFHDFNIEVLRGLWRNGSSRKSLENFYEKLLDKKGVSRLLPRSGSSSENESEETLSKMQKKFLEVLERKGFHL